MGEREPSPGTLANQRFVERLRRRVCIECEAASTSLLCRDCSVREFHRRHRERTR